MRRYNQSSLLISVLALVAAARCRGALAETAPAAEPAAEQASRVIVGRHAQMGSRISGCCGAAEVGAAFAAAAAATQDRCRRHMVRFCRPSQPARRRSRLLPLAVCLRGPTTAPQLRQTALRLLGELTRTAPHFARLGTPQPRATGSTTLPQAPTVGLGTTQSAGR